MHIVLLHFVDGPATPDYEMVSNELRALGHTVWIATSKEKGVFEWHDGTQIIATQRVTGRSKLPVSVAQRLEKLRLLRQVRRFIRETKPDIVQQNTFNMFLYLPLGMSRRTRFILDLRQINEMYGSGLVGRTVASLRNKSRVFAARHIFDRTTFLHEAGAAKVLGKSWARWASVVPMGVDPRFLSAPNSLDYDGAAGRSVEFVYIGRLDRVRKLERIIEAGALLKQRSNRFRITFIGYDGTDGYYSAMIEHLKLGDEIRVCPPVPYEMVPETTLEYDVALAYVPELPLDWQYHPTLKVLEYRALGIPIIASDFLPNREIVEHGVNGLLVKNTVESIAEAMQRFINDPDLLIRCRKNATLRRKGVTWDKVAIEYLDLYHQLKLGRTLNTKEGTEVRRLIN